MCYAVQSKCLVTMGGCPSSADAGHHSSSAPESVMTVMGLNSGMYLGLPWHHSAIEDICILKVPWLGMGFCLETTFYARCA